MEESVGFEPTVLTHDGFQDRCIKPGSANSPLVPLDGNRTHPYFRLPTAGSPCMAYGFGGRIRTCDNLINSQGFYH